MADVTSLVLPPELKPSDGRFGCGPSKVRPEALAALAGVGRVGARHLAPAGPGEDAGPPGPRGPGHAVLAAGRLPGDPGQRRHHRVLGRRRARPGPGAGPAPDVRRVLRQVRHRHPQGAVPGRPAGHRGRPRRRARPGRGRRRRRLRLGAQRDLHRGGRPGAPAGRCDRRPAGADRRHLRRRRAAGRHRPGRRLLLRPAEGLRLRRRAVDRAGLPGRAGPDRRDRRDRTGGSRSSCRSRPRWTTPARTRR